jgi:predicted nucleic acid-binding Zn ribbon protein
MRCLKNGHGIQIVNVVFSSDVYVCPKCGAQTAVGMSRRGVQVKDWPGEKSELEL